MKHGLLAITQLGAAATPKEFYNEVFKTFNLKQGFPHFLKTLNLF
jgi:hypothetical protein